ncbi:MAG: bi-domain-containing oxidoreductase [Candidatus Cloacimonetes bacterium]|nr:bi-domain-containing oxidoreductase [Candidatus Cloacimonadota bacterium]
MKQVFKSNLGIVVDDVPIPVCGNKQVLVKTVFSLISTGTETSFMRKRAQSLGQKIVVGGQNLIKLKEYLLENGYSAAREKFKSKIKPSKEIEKLQETGYSVSGIVSEVGKAVSEYKIGDRVACSGSGFAAHAEYVSVPVNLVQKLPDSVGFDAAAFTTLGCIALQGIRRAELQIGDTVVIIGLGLLGLLGVQISKANGLKVIGIDLVKEKMDLAKSLGADFVFDALDAKLSNKIRLATERVGADAVIVYAASKSGDIIDQAMAFCRRKGKVIIVGDVPLDFKRESMYEKELDLLMSTSYGPGRYDDSYEMEGIDYPIAYVKWTENRNMHSFLSMLENGSVKVDALISAIMPVEKAKEAFELLSKDARTAIGALLKYQDPEQAGSETPMAEKVFFLNKTDAVKGIIRTAFIGTGNFTQKIHLPNIHKLKEHYLIDTICNRRAGLSKVLGKKYHSKKITSDYKAVLADSDVDLVVIGTRHDSHGPLVIEALEAGKHVFVEKPLCIKKEELNKIEELCRDSKLQLMVGFNRRFSPLSKLAKENISKLDSPKYIVYRVNAGYQSPNGWIQDLSIGGGRIIGECCHFIDLIKFYIDAPLMSYDFSFIPSGIGDIESADNVSITCKFADGSLGIVHYATVGNPKLPKELIEIHQAGKSMVLDDFKNLYFYGYNRKKIKLKSVQKGFIEEMLLFAQAIRKGQALIDLQSIFDTTRMTIEMQEEIGG